MKTVEKMKEKVVKVCPICGLEMEKGFYIVPRETWWDINKHSQICWKCEMINPFKFGLTNFPAYRCKKCKLIIFKYGGANESKS
ncbi:MAG: PF20097 family protein [Candidatus Bathyarchaeia archaeon]